MVSTSVRVECDGVHFPHGELSLELRWGMCYEREQTRSWSRIRVGTRLVSVTL